PGTGPRAVVAHRPADAVAQDGRQRREHRRMRWPARPDLRLDERDVGELDLDDHLVWPGPHLGHLGRLEHLRRAELPYHYRSHARPPSRNSSSPANEPKGVYRSAQRAGVLGPSPNAGPARRPMPAGAAPAYRNGETDRSRWWSCWSWRPNGSAARRC